MIRKLGLAAGLLIAGVATASAQSITLNFGPPPPRPIWTPGMHPYAQRHHDICHRKAWRLHQFERYAVSDGRVSRREQIEINQLRYDLDRTCGRYRWRG